MASLLPPSGGLDHEQIAVVMDWMRHQDQHRE